VAFRLQPQLFLYFYLDPESLAVEAVLVPLLMAGHGEVALESILEGAAPGVVHAHGVVGRDRPIEKRPLRLARILSAKPLEGMRFLPEFQDLVLAGNEVGTTRYLLEHQSILGMSAASPLRFPSYPLRAARRQCGARWCAA